MSLTCLNLQTLTSCVCVLVHCFAIFNFFTTNDCLGRGGREPSAFSAVCSKLLKCLALHSLPFCILSLLQVKDDQRTAPSVQANQSTAPSRAAPPQNDSDSVIKASRAHVCKPHGYMYTNTVMLVFMIKIQTIRWVESHHKTYSINTIVLQTSF